MIEQLARWRAVAVERFGARRGLTGEPLEPDYPATADALAVGELRPEHAAVIADTVEAIPAADRAEHAERVEATLLAHARTENPRIRTCCGCSASGSWPTSIRTGPARTNSGCSKPTGE